MIPVNKEVVGSYQVIAPDGVLLQDVTDIIIKGMTDKSYICDLYAAENCVAVDRRFSFDSVLCDQLTVGEIGLLSDEIPTSKWLVAEIKLYLNYIGIEYTSETKAQLLALIPIPIEGE